MSHASPDFNSVPTLLLFALVPRTIDPAERAEDEILAYRREIFRLVPIDPGSLTHLSVLRDANQLRSEALSTSNDWSGGYVDIATFGSIDDLLRAYETVLRAQRHRAPSPAWSAHAYATVAFSVRPLDPAAPVRKFTIGGALRDVSRRDWLSRWRSHGSLISEAPTFGTYLKGYIQYHFLDESLTGEIGTPDGHSIAQTGWASLAEMDHAYSLPDYRSVLRRDESNLIVKDKMVRVLAGPLP
jgi:hypothetical protein